MSNSHSRTPTPTPNTIPSNTPPPPPTRLSPRSQPERDFASEIASSSGSHRSDSSPQPPTKRRRRSREMESTISRPTRSSPSSSSHEGIADSEHPSAAATSSSQRKRTRTLTTPHQTAVLQALLAKSRFPSTAMREEVGRSIGLSARKVQIWFQNQRQKARNAQSQNVPQPSRPPQYGPFPNAPTPSTAGGPLYSNFALDPVPPQPPRYDPRPGYHAHHHSYPGPLDIGGMQLQGPGVPGSGSASAFRHYHDPPAHLGGDFPRTHASSHSYPDSSSRSPVMRRHTHRDATLPPLMFEGSTRDALAQHPPHTSSSSNFTSAPPHDNYPPFAYHGHLRQSSNVIMSPPFTLQPQPQWDTSAYSANATLGRPTSSWDYRAESESERSYRGGEPPDRDRPGSSHSTGTGTRTGSIDRHRHRRPDRMPSLSTAESTTTTTTTVVATLGREERDPYHVMEPEPPQRLRRFDPVRSTFVSFVTGGDERRVVPSRSTTPGPGPAPGRDSPRPRPRDRSSPR